jgi:NADH-quinone oxidoreductase subunit G
MLNHPHDCPVCDEGGECHLQDMTVMTGHTERRTRFKKRTHRNQYLGPFINHEMNRCIQCYRCVRYYRDYAGGRDLNVFSAHDHVYFGRHEDGVLESEFSGNLVEVCPTGVFTDKTLKQHYARKWDLQTAPSICVHCGLGCNTIAGERYGTLRRILNRYHLEVNGYFLCDRGRFGYEFVNSEKRIKQPMLSASLSPSPQGRDANTSSPLAGEGRGLPSNASSGGEGARPVDKEAVLAHITAVLSGAKGIIGIGSPRASLESNFVLRSLVGPDNFYSGMSGPDHRLVSLIIDIHQKGPARSPSLRDVRMADAVVVLGEDLTNTAPLLALSLRQAVRGKEFEAAAKLNIPEWNDAGVRNAGQGARNPLFIASPASTKLDDIAMKTYHAAPDDIARLGFAIAHELDPSSPAVPGPAGETASLAREIAHSLKNAKRPLVISGTSLFNGSIVQAAANIATALCAGGKSAALCYAVPECNSMGLGIMGGRNLDEAFTVMNDDLADTVIVLENDLYRRADAGKIEAFLARAKHVIVLDHILNRTASRADILLPAGTFAESHGTLVNNEGRAQRFYQVFIPQGDIQSSWKWIHAIMSAAGRTEDDPMQSLESVAMAMAAAFPVFAPVKDIAPHAGFRINGMKVPRQPHRYSGRTSMNADVSVNEDKPREDADTPLAFSMEGSEEQPPSPLITGYWSPGWNSVQALNKYQQEIGGELRDNGSGKRLIEPNPDGKPAYFTIDPAKASNEQDAAAAPKYHIFGSEELSSYSPAIEERAKTKKP